MKKCPAELKKCDTRRCADKIDSLKGPFGGCGLGNVPDQIVKKINAISECRLEKVCGSS